MDSSSLAVLEPWLALWLLILGLVIGSFLNVVIARLPHGQSVVQPRSRCPHCGHQLAWYENIPVFSWLALRGKCRSCKASISVRYVLVELMTGMLYLACLRRFGWDWELVSALVLVTLLVPLTFIDLEHWILPHELTKPGIAAGVLLALPMGMDRFWDAAIGAALGFFLFWGMEFVGAKIFKKEALGGGDKWLLAMLGGFLTWKMLLGIIFLSSLQGALVGSLLLLVRGRAGPAAEPAPAEPPHKEKPKADPAKKVDEDEEDDWQPGPTNIPFGPWLSIAALEILLLGPWLGTVLPDTLQWIVTGRLVIE